MKNNATNEFLTPKGVCEKLNVSREFLLRLTSSGGCPTLE